MCRRPHGPGYTRVPVTPGSRVYPGAGIPGSKLYCVLGMPGPRVYQIPRIPGSRVNPGPVYTIPGMGSCKTCETLWPHSYWAMRPQGGFQIQGPNLLSGLIPAVLGRICGGSGLGPRALSGSWQNAAARRTQYLKRRCRLGRGRCQFRSYFMLGWGALQQYFLLCPHVHTNP